MEMQGWPDRQHKQEKAIGQMSFASSSKFLGHYSPSLQTGPYSDQSPREFRGMGQVPYIQHNSNSEQRAALWG